MPRVLITGAAGFIGMHTSIRFLKEGWEVIGLDNMNDYYSVRLKENRLNEIEKFVKSVNGEFRLYKEDLNSEVWVKLKKIHFDALIHLAAQAGVRYSIENPMAYLKSNVIGFQRVLDFVATKKLERFIYASSSSVYGNDSSQPFVETASCNSPESYYASTKKANELMAKAFNKTHSVSSIGLRFFTVYGPWGRPDMAPMLFADAAFNYRPIKVFNHGNQRRDFTYIDDVVEGIIKLVFLPKFPKHAEIYNIGNGSPVHLMDFIRNIEKSSSIELEKQFIEAQIGDVSETYADTLKLFNAIGYKPKINISDGIDRFICWYKDYYQV